MVSLVANCCVSAHPVLKQQHCTVIHLEPISANLANVLRQFTLIYSFNSVSAPRQLLGEICG